MPRKRYSLDVDDLVGRYEGGETLRSIADDHGCSIATIRRRLVKRGVPIRGPGALDHGTVGTGGNPVVRIDVDDMVRRYKAGASVKKLADDLGVSRSAVSRRLKQRGVDVRGRSEAERIKWAAMTSGAVVRQCSAAWNAARGRVKTDAEKRRAAMSHYLNATRIGRGEDKIADGLRAIGLTVEQQLPVGPYNVDVAVREGCVAVEVMGAWPKANGSVPFRERVEHILDAGWLLLWVDATWGKRVSVANVAKYVLALPEVTRPDEAGRRGQWVIRSDSEEASTMGAKLHELTLVPCPQARIDRAAN